VNAARLRPGSRAAYAPLDDRAMKQIHAMSERSFDIVPYVEEAI
jgi:hypothetical protein